MSEESKEFKKKMEELKNHFGNLLSEDTLKMLTAYSLGELEHDIDDLQNVRGKVTISGSIEEIYEVKKFSTEKRRGLVGNARLRVEGEKERVIKAVFWNEAAQKLKKISKGDSVSLSGFVKQRKGELEISVNRDSDIKVTEKNIEEIQGVLLAKKEISEGVKGVLSGDKGAVVFTVHEDTAASLREIEDGSNIKIRGGERGKTFTASQVELLGEGTKEFQVEFTPVSELRSMHMASLKGRMSGLGEVKQHKKRVLAEIFISDDSGRVKLVLWDDNVSIYKETDIGDHIEVYNGYPKIDWNGEMEVHCGWNCMTILRRA